jgi:hypothetical protein
VQFHLGSAGSLYTLPVVEHTEQVDATRVPHHALQRTLTGALIRDVLGRARGRWVIDWRYLSPDQLAVLSALAAGRLGTPLRLIDPERPNLAHPQLATGGTEERSTDGWLATSGALDWVQITDPPAGVLANGAVDWTRSTTAAGDLAPGRVGYAYRAPVLGSQQMRLSQWVRATAGSFSASFGVDGFDAAGARTTELAAAAAVPASWTELSYTWTPAAGAVEVAPVLRIADAQPTGTVQTTGVMIVYGSTALDWQEGGGAPLVVVEALTETRPAAGEYHTRLTLLEA